MIFFDDFSSDKEKDQNKAKETKKTGYIDDSFKECMLPRSIHSEFDIKQKILL